FGPGTYPRGYKVQTSADGRTWGEPVAQGKGTGATLRVALEKPAEAKAVRVTLTAPAQGGSSWTVQKVRLYEAVKAPTPGSREPRVGTMPLAEVLDAISTTKGDARRGER